MSNSQHSDLVSDLAADEYEYVSVDELHDHPENEEIYGEIDPDESFINDIRENGVETPLIVNRHSDTEAEWDLPNTIIGGHRRITAARRVGLNAVPVKWEEYPEPQATRRLVLNNLNRTKTAGQETREMLTLEETARSIAAEELSEAGRRGGKKGRVNSHDPSDDTKRWDVQIADDLGIGQSSVRYATDVYRFAYPDEYVHDDLQNPEKYNVPEEVREEARQQVEKMEAGKQSFYGGYDEVTEVKNNIESEREKQRRLDNFSEAVEDDDAVTIYNKSVSDLVDELDEQSIDCIITDPPYDEGAVQDWQSLAEFAAAVLEPGGLLAAYSGKYHLPAVHDALGSSLEYYWQFVVRHTGAGARVWQRNIRTDYKPVLVYAKPPADSLDTLTHDVIEGGGREKEDHEWQQATAEAIELVDRLTEPDDLILDPMCGSGTTGTAALHENRRVILADRDDEAVETARRRVGDVL